MCVCVCANSALSRAYVFPLCVISLLTTLIYFLELYMREK